MEHETTQPDIAMGDLEQARNFLAALAQRAQDESSPEDRPVGKEHTLVVVCPTFFLRVPGALAEPDEAQDSLLLFRKLQSGMRRLKKVQPVMSQVYVGAVGIDAELDNGRVISPTSVSAWSGSLSTEIDSAKGVTAKELLDQLVAGKAYDSILSSAMKKDLADLMANMGMANHEIAALMGVCDRQVRRYRQDKRRDLAAAYKKEGVQGAIGRLVSAYESSYKAITHALSSPTEPAVERAKMAKMSFDMTSSFVNAVRHLLAS